MFQRFIRIWEFLTHSLWFTPLLYAILGVAFALLSTRIPGSDLIGTLPEFWPRFSTIDTAKDLISTLLGALVTMITFALSITMVVLTLAAGSLGPRTIRNFMGDPKTQNSIGCFVGSILFLIGALVIMGGTSKNVQVPQILTMTGIGLFVICLFVLIFFVHNLGRSIVADQVIYKVGSNLEKTISSALETLKSPIDTASKDHCTLPDSSEIDDDHAIIAKTSGYVQGLDYEAIRDEATKHGITVSLIVHAGQHVIKGDFIGEIKPTKNQDQEPKPLNECQDAIKNYIMIGNQRTEMLDVEFALRQLVEIALRALSPGINDPFTAIAVVYQLGRALPKAMPFHYPVGVWKDDDGHTRICSQINDFGGMLEASFNQIRQAACTKPDVLLPMAEVLESLISLTHDAKQRDVLCHHATLIANTAKRDIPETTDCATVQQAVDRVLRKRPEPSKPDDETTRS